MSLLLKLAHLQNISTHIPVIPGGRFSITSETTAVLDHQNTKYVTDLSLRSDFSFANKKKKISFVQNYTNWAGVNKKYIDDSGDFNMAVAIDDFAKVAAEKRVIRGDVVRLLEQWPRRDSHEAFLYNMMITWGHAMLYRLTGGKEGVYNIVTRPYSDSHVIVADHVGRKTEMTHEIVIGVPATGGGNPGWILREEEKFWDRRYVLRYPNRSSAQEAFYLSHVLGRDQVSILNFDVAIPGLDTNQLMLDPIGTAAHGGGIASNLDGSGFEDPDRVWSWVMDYVAVNRLHMQFASVFETFSAMCAQPGHSSAEACSWQQAALSLRLAIFSPMRGMIRTAFEGEEFCPYPDTLTMLLREGRVPDQFVQASALMNYYHLYGTYSLLHNEARARDQWRTVFESAEEALYNLDTPVARATAISAVIGQEVSTAMTDGCYMNYDYSDMYKVTRIVDVQPVDGSTTSFDIDAIYAPVDGALLLGVAAGGLETTDHLMSVQTFEKRQFDGEPMTSTEAHQIAVAYRLFGYDTVWATKYSRETVMTWANVASIIVDPAVLYFDNSKEDYFRALDAERRSGRSRTLPNIANFIEDGAVMQIQKPRYKVTEHGDRKMLSRPYTRIQRGRKPTNVLISAPVAYTSARYVAKPVKHNTVQDFRGRSLPITPANPEGLKTATRDDVEITDSASMAQTLTSVHGVE